jgi:hypothetical protein
MSLRPKGYFLYLRLTLMGEPEFTTGQEAKEEVEDLISIREYHHDGEDLSKFPFIVYTDDAGSPDLHKRPIWLCLDPCRISPHLEHGSVNSQWNMTSHSL